MPEMMLQLAESSPFPGYTPVSDGNETYFVHDGFLQDLGRRKKKGGIFGFVKKLALAPGRRAFRTLVALNVHGMAKKMKKTLLKIPDSLKTKWEKMGGNFDALKKTIEIGAKRKQLFDGTDLQEQYGIREDETYLKEIENRLYANGLSAAPLVAFIAAATPILIAMKPLFKKSGADTAETGGTDINMVIDQAQSAATAAGILPEHQTDPTLPGNDTKFDPDKGKDDEPKKDDTKIFGMPKIVVFGGAALAAILLLRKK